MKKNRKIYLRDENLGEGGFGRLRLLAHKLAAALGIFRSGFRGSGLLFLATGVLILFCLLWLRAGGLRVRVLCAAADAEAAHDGAQPIGGGGARHRDGQHEADYFAQVMPGHVLS